MRYVTTDDPEKGIRQLKSHMEAGQMRLTFLWPLDIEQVYIFKTGEEFDIETATNGRLFTLQEYKKYGGYIEPRPCGAFVYRIYPFKREHGEDIAVIYEGTENEIKVTGQIPIRFSLTEKTGFFSKAKVHTVILTSQQDIDSSVLCYVKKADSYPSDKDDGTVYFFGDSLIAGVPGHWEIKTAKNEYIRIFVREPDKTGVYLTS